MSALADLCEQLEHYTDEVLELRYSAAGDPSGAPGLPDSGTPLDDVLVSLVATRRRIDRVEELLSEAVLARGRIRRLTDHVEAQASNAWDEAVTTDPRISSGSFVAPKEKYAQANLATMSLRRQVVEAKAALSRADDAVEIIRQAHRGLDSLRYDHVVMIRAATVLNSLEV